MTWIRYSDQAHRAEALLLAGRDGKLLWFDALGECAAFNDGAGRDGVLTPVMVRAAAVLSDPPLNHKRLTPKLVELGLWHDVETVAACSDCMVNGGARLHPTELLIHEWWEHLLGSAGKADPIERNHELRRKRLHRNARLKAAVRTRDRDLCRYCGSLTTWTADHKSPAAGTFDHVDPFGPNTMDNVVVACRRCNGRKRDRTPEQAGMDILPEPDPYQPTIQPHPATDQPTDPATGLDSLTRARETGPGRIVAGSDQPTGPDRAGSVAGSGDPVLVPLPASNGHGHHLSNGNGAH